MKLYKKLGIILAAIAYASLAYVMLVQPRTKQAPNRDTPFYITPHIQGLDLLDPEAIQRLTTLLNSLEPNGAKGDVRLGYTLGFELYDYYVKGEQGWSFDRERLRSILKSAKQIGRPVVLYVGSNHFFGASPYAQYLQTLPETTMRYANGDAPDETYFRTHLAPFRISNDTGLPHIKAKFDALDILAEEIHVLGDLLVAITLNGETHYLFTDFFSGTGRFAGAELTDYKDSPMGRPFQAYEDGVFPVYGWYCGYDPILIYRDGKYLMQAENRLGRLDVYEAGASNKDANCGFRASLDFSNWPEGNYAIQVLVNENGALKQLPNGQFTVRVGSEHRNSSVFITLPSTVSGWVDSKNTRVTYRPEMREWMHMRERIIQQHVEKMASILQTHGVSKERIYSHQLAPWLNADWNTTLFGIGRGFFQSDRMQAGITLYGGTTMSEAVLPYLPKDRHYGIPEFHPQMEDNKGHALHAMYYHMQRNAAFLAPYFMNISVAQQEKNSHDSMMIDPSNPLKGSDDLYHAIAEIVKH